MDKNIRIIKMEDTVPYNRGADAETLLLLRYLLSGQRVNAGGRVHIMLEDLDGLPRSMVIGTDRAFNEYPIGNEMTVGQLVELARTLTDNQKVEMAASLALTQINRR